MNQVNGKVASTAMVIFGVTGDLTRRKLVPSLYELALKEKLPEPFYVIGFARRDWSDEFLREKMKEGILAHAETRPINESVLNHLLENMHYNRSTFENEPGYEELDSLLNGLHVANRLYYLATPPSEFAPIITNLGKANLQLNDRGWARIVIEKPYGNDLDSAKALDEIVHQVFEERQVYRIDHYLGKETVQNILVFRFANGIFEPLWNRRYVDHIQITVAESIGIEGRGNYYEKAGVIRDIFQNHMLQLLTLTTMDPPVAFTAKDVRDEKVKVLRSLRHMSGEAALENTYRAQYVPGFVNGERVRGYKEEPGVAPDSIVETYLEMRAFIDDWRWSGVPIYMRSGKSLPQRETEIAIFFKQVPISLFKSRNLSQTCPNVLALNIQPDEGITLTFGAKAPGVIDTIASVKMSFDYVQTFGVEPPEAYQRLLMDCMVGDPTLFLRDDEVLASWAFITPILEAWAEAKTDHIPVYEAGTWGPPGADDLIRQDGRAWRQL